MSHERADQDELRAERAAIDPRTRPTDLRSLVAGGPMRNPALEPCTLAKSEVDQEPFESERTGVWTRAVETTTEALGADPNEDSHVALVSARPRLRRRVALVVAAAAVVVFLGWSLSPTQVVPAPAPSEARPMAEHVARGPREAESHERRASARAEPSTHEEPVEPVEPEPEPEPEDVLEIDEAELAALEAARRAEVAARRARAEAARLVAAAGRALEEGRRAEAIPMFERALELDETLATAAVGLSTAYFDEGAFERAVSFGERAVSLDDASAEHHVTLGDAYFRVGRLQDARRHWEHARTLGSSRAEKRLTKHAP